MKKLFKNLIGVCVLATFALSLGLPIFQTKNDVTVDAIVPEYWHRDNAGEFRDVTHEPEDYAYSFAVVGDTQYVTMYDTRARAYPTKYDATKTDNLSTLYKWIADNAESKKIKHVMGLGDITHLDSNSEWKIAKAAISQLDGVVPYSLVRGNHDNRLTYFDYYFSDINEAEPSNYISQKGLIDYYKGYGEEYRARNTAHVFTGGNVDYLLIALDFGVSDEVLEWANEVVAAHPNHTVIVTTHAYLGQNGEVLDGKLPHSASGYNEKYRNDYGQFDADFNDGTDIWDKFVRRHKNISMVFSGHVINTMIVRTEAIGDHGNVVQQIMINPQSLDDDDKYGDGTPFQESLTGMVAIFYCSEDGKTVDVQWYSTLQDKEWSVELDGVDQNQFQLTGKNANGADTVTAMARKESSIAVRANGEGKITPTYQELTGGEVLVSIEPSEYFEFSKLYHNKQDVTHLVELIDGVFTYKVTANDGYHYLLADMIEKNRYAFIEQNDLSKGRLVLSDRSVNATYQAGTSFDVTVIPNEGYTVESVTYNGQALTPNAEGKYTVTIAAQENTFAVKYVGENAEQTPSGGGDTDSSAPSGSGSENSDGGAKESGCAGTVSVGALAAFCAVAACVAFKKKKENN